jgi:hypothetical protein
MKAFDINLECHIDPAIMMKIAVPLCGLYH